nr:hypothetical protein [Tanacetum cinerariifolium]
NSGIVKMAGQADDPISPTVGSTAIVDPAVGNTTAWMDGQYEFLITIVYNPKDGQPPQTNVRFSVSPSQIYTANYQPGSGFFGRFNWVLASVTPKQMTITTTYAANFSFDPTFASIVKLGAKFGASAQTVNQRTVSVQYTTGSTDLGEMTNFFYDPIVVNDVPGSSDWATQYWTYEIAPGGTASNVYLSVEPYSVIESDN